jgi:hypothetical protein
MCCWTCLRKPLAHAVGADVVDGALVAVIARVALIDVVLSAFACSAVIIIIIIIIILKEEMPGIPWHVDSLV